MENHGDQTVGAADVSDDDVEVLCEYYDESEGTTKRERKSRDECINELHGHVIGP